MSTLGIDLGGTKILAAVVEDGRVLDRVRVDTPQTGFDAVVAAMAGAARELIGRGYQVTGVGVGSPGPLDHERGRVVFAPNIAGMVDAPLVEALERSLGLPVELENDANAAGYAEHLYGAARELRSSVYVTLSTGIGGGLFVGDTLIRGAHGLAGEIGHITMLPGGPMGGDGHTGSLEAIAAGRSIARDATYAYGRQMSTVEVFERARAGERMALGIVDNAATFTGIGLANIQKVFDPEAFVLGGGLTAAGEFYLERVRAAAARYLVGFCEPRFRMAVLGGDAGVIGAAAVAERAFRSRG
ncbi:MAG TPA: ROK family protein [Trueperaceae bacterium]|nr:ROK family protein [Trueperaceae bacterium]